MIFFKICLSSLDCQYVFYVISYHKHAQKFTFCGGNMHNRRKFNWNTVVQPERTFLNPKFNQIYPKIAKFRDPKSPRCRGRLWLKAPDIEVNSHGEIVSGKFRGPFHNSPFSASDMFSFRLQSLRWGHLIFRHLIDCCSKFRYRANKLSLP